MVTDKCRQFSVYKSKLKQLINDLYLDDMDTMPSETKSLFMSLGDELEKYFETKGGNHHERVLLHIK